MENMNTMNTTNVNETAPVEEQKITEEVAREYVLKTAVAIATDCNTKNIGVYVELLRHIDCLSIDDVQFYNIHDLETKCRAFIIRAACDLLDDRIDDHNWYAIIKIIKKKLEDGSNKQLISMYNNMHDLYTAENFNNTMADLIIASIDK